MGWTIYMHTCPNGKRYIGITSQEPKKRWRNGLGYRKQYFYKAVKKFGWSSIRHEILRKDLSMEEAVKLETTLIKFYQCADRKKGYNISKETIIKNGKPTSADKGNASYEYLKMNKKFPKKPSIKVIPNYPKSRPGFKKENIIRGMQAKSSVVVQYDCEWNPVGIWEGVRHAFLSTGINPHPSLQKGCLSGGFYWKKGIDIDSSEFVRLFNASTPVYMLTGEIIPLNICEVPLHV